MRNVRPADKSTLSDTVNHDPTLGGDSRDSAHGLLPQALHLIAASLVLGALAGLLATAFHLALSAAERLRELVLAVQPVVTPDVN